MNLLPKSKEQFKSKEYWDKFFREREESFEWYGNYGELSTILHKYCKTSDRVLVLGCGNSRLSEDLYDLGYHGLVNIDISDVVIRQMKERNVERRREMEFIRMDMLKMEFEADTFNVILDKGTLDAIFVNQSDEVVSDVDKMFAEIHRVLKTNGRYICITLCQDHILNKLLQHFVDGWFIRVHKIETLNNSPLPVFAFIFTKTKMSGLKNDSFPRILETCLDGTEKIKRVPSTVDIKNAIDDFQKYAMVKQSIGKFKPGETYSVELWDTSTIYGEKHREPRYTLTVVDTTPSLTQNGLFAIFVVPQGQETDWMFVSEEGRAELSSTANFQRLVIATLHRDHDYQNIEQIKEELSNKVMDLAPNGVTNEKQVPFLSDGGDIGVREILHKGNSEHSGDYVIEEVVVREEKLRRLLFFSSVDVIQSEARIKTESMNVKGKKGKVKKSKNTDIDHSYLNGKHCQGMVTGLAFVQGLLDKDSKKRGLLVGLGGGCLSMFIHQFYPQVAMDTIERDPQMVEVAKKWFGFIEDDHLRIIIEDGLKFIEQASIKGAYYDLIIFDVDQKDKAINMTSPSTSFLDPGFLVHVKKLLRQQGVLIINFNCQDKELRTELLNNLQTAFTETYVLKIQGVVNEVIFALPGEPNNQETQESRMDRIKNSVKDLQKYGEVSKHWDEELDLCDIIENLMAL